MQFVVPASTASDWLPDSPMRKPDWRLRRAEHRFVRGALHDRRIDDPWVDRAVRVLRRGEAPPGPSLQAAATAVQLARGSDPELRDRLEALLLTEAPFELVARRTGLPPETVEAFHAMCFCVRERLRAVDWIAIQGIGVSPIVGGADASTVRRVLAWRGGLLGFDVAEAALHSMGLLPAPPPGSPEFPRMTLRIARRWIKVLRMPADTPALVWARMHLKLIENERKREQERAAARPVVEAVLPPPAEPDRETLRLDDPVLVGIFETLLAAIAQAA